jgi:1-acyl-sn-glycerol-3-phosphate acyltransferase
MAGYKPDILVSIDPLELRNGINVLKLVISSTITMIGYMNLPQLLLVTTMRVLTKLFFRVHIDGVSKIPFRGPLIIVSNHINNAEVGILYGLLMPRPVTGFMAEYRWDPLWSRWLGQIADAIPLNRGEADIGALKIALKRLKSGKIIAMAPEGTRSKHGRLQRAHPGAVLLALWSNAPLLPLVFYGHEHWIKNLKRFRRTDFYLKVGEPFHLQPPEPKVNKEIRRQMIDEVMYQIAALLPESYRGVYSDRSKATSEFISFL